ncbi:GntR family transcriptional regulator [Polynucleobacter kasalickyi]|uniref:Transcriptional regulator, GntR family n=1 Tax=Polynucleobacter kasalickyi TaxID=1938817 RepID=A0A1W2BK37_9BURK|nr:GntR family transcriptional regulator [Polynucleobacter kasalickyi]SMC72878.1 transcriptional regulator, GntR family [Polynucleobacter kasalickyi]
MSLASRPLYLDIADVIREKIFQHELKPGAWINEKEITEELEISRTPLREAIKVLAAEGLITMKLRRGAYVTEVETTDLANIFEVISILEAQAAYDVAKDATENELEILDKVHTRLEKAAADRDIDGFFELNQEFHDLIQQFAGNPWMRKVIQDLRQVLKLQRKNSLRKIGRVEQSLIEHRQILSALIGRKPEQAKELMHSHLLHGQKAAV